MKIVTLDLMRHGEPQRRDIYLGRTDLALSAAGLRQSRAALSPGGWQQVWCSPLRRCAAVAREFAASEGIMLREDRRIAEYDFGDWDGRAQAAVYAQAPQAVEAFWAAPEQAPPPGGESLAAFRRRVLAALDDALSQPEERLLWVTHGGVIRALLAECLGLAPARWQCLSVDYCGFTRIRWYLDGPGRWHQVAYINRLATG